MSTWDKFDKEMDLEGLQEDIKKAKEEGSGAQREEVPKGEYEVKIEKLELVETKKKPQRPMVSVWMRIVTGEYKSQIIFMNQLVDEGWKIDQSNQFLQSLESGVPVEFESYSQYDELLLDIHEAIDKQLEYAIKYGETKTGYPTYKILEVFELD